MKRPSGNLVLALLAFQAFAPAADKPPKSPLPFKEESLKYNINGPGGARLGNAVLTARQTSFGWEFDLSLDAGAPGYTLSDHYHAVASPPLCSIEFQKDATHGRRHVQEKMLFDYPQAVARRENTAGAKSEIPISGCARDALTYLFYARSQLDQGHLSPSQTVLAGASYQVTLEAGGAEPVQIGKTTETADHAVISVRGPASNFSFEVFFARDKARAPLVVRCPFSIGTVSLELVR